MRINFRFRLLVMWSSPHGHDASSHKIWCIYFNPVRTYWHFSEIENGMAAVAILHFQSVWIWPYPGLYSVAFVFCTKFGSNVCYSHLDRRTYIDIFPKFKMAVAAILDFQFLWIWASRRVDSMVFMFCAKFGLNICYSHWDRRTYVTDLHLMTSRELTSDFDFWSRGHLRMAVMHLPIKFVADVFIYPKRSYWYFFQN